jgi:hypothetical protein
MIQTERAESMGDERGGCNGKSWALERYLEFGLCLERRGALQRARSQAQADKVEDELTRTWPLHPPAKVCECPVGVRKPQQAKHCYNHYLADNGKTIDQEGTDSAAECRFDKIQHIHSTTSHIPGWAQEPVPKLPPARRRGNFISSTRNNAKIAVHPFLTPTCVECQVKM